MAKRAKFVYLFGVGKTEGRAHQKDLLGGKGANLAEMCYLGLPVPPGFTITTEVCAYFYKNKRAYPPVLKKDVQAALVAIEKKMGAKFGDPKNSLLLSVRSGARASMPGMMDTILNLGLNDMTVQGLAEKTKNARFAYDSYRRFVQMYGDVVMGLKPTSKHEIDPFEAIIEEIKKNKGVTFDIDLDAEDLKELVRLFKQEIKRRLGKDFPEDPQTQLWGAIGAVFGSWQNERAIEYRRLNKIPSDWGTAVNVQAMVFGNMGDDCATGVAFTRNPASGEKSFYGEYLRNAQGEDVVAGIRTPKPVVQLGNEMPKAYKELRRAAKVLEKHYRDMQDLEFTIQHRKLWMLQTRNGKRTGFASCRIAADMVKEKLIKPETAVMRVEPDQLLQLLAPIFDLKAKEKAIDEGALLAKGLPAGPGAATGRVVFAAEDVAETAKLGEKVILVRIETSPEDIKGMAIAEGILTQRGGMTSHAALVARQMGKVCVVGCDALSVDYQKQTMTVKGRTIAKGDFISLDGTRGEVLAGRISTVPSEVEQALFGAGPAAADAKKSKTFKAYKKLMEWADKFRKLGTWTNADQPDQAAKAVAYGAEGIGLCRTEHMFFGGERIDAVREMILADTVEEREKALAKLLPMQRDDFIGIFSAMGAKPVTIRLLDPPLHEFLPKTEEDFEKLSTITGRPVSEIKAKAETLHEFNPMLGHRGCRLGITYPEIYMMQVRAIAEAAYAIAGKGKEVQPEIMIPLVGHINELKIIREYTEKVIAEVAVNKRSKIKFHIGTMIELPRAALTADEIAKEADFFSFGTNDLTQTAFGLSRDDAGRFLAEYVEKGILPDNPFITIDQAGVGLLLEMGTKKGRSTNPKLKVGICGEHGGDPDTIAFCHKVGLTYVSCSPPRVPIARLAAARAALKEKGVK